MTPGKQTVSASSTRSRRAAPGGAAPALLLVGLGLVATTGCEDDPLRLRVRVDAPRTLVPGEINAVRVSFAGSRG
ncbi:MAG: hypothetical protein JXB32_01830, partial [Deltaproteobacteria bacterium]|nr:hypothetical protein [Deltaproteobacteria bacterium]